MRGCGRSGLLHLLTELVEENSPNNWQCDKCQNIYQSEKDRWIPVKKQKRTLYYCEDCYIELKRKKAKKKMNTDSDKKQADLALAKNFETALNYQDAAQIYEKYELWEEAGRCRRLEKVHTSQKTKVDINRSITINDSVVNRTIIGESVETIKICPYCGKDLDLPNPPRYCPYCKEQIVK